MVVVPLTLALGTAGGAATAAADTEPPRTPPPVTVNEFLPQERGLGDCISAIPRPGCGSEARGGWRQTVVFLAVVGGLSIIAWRIVGAARRGNAPG